MLTKSGTIYCRGKNDAGMLGNGSREDSPTPVKVIGIEDATDVACGYRHCCAVRKDKTVACWGANDKGQIGDGTTLDRDTPVSLAELTDVIGIATGTEHSCALRQDGSIVCWGAGKTKAKCEEGEGGVCSFFTNIPLPSSLSPCYYML